MAPTVGFRSTKWATLSAIVGLVAFVAYVYFFTDFNGVVAVIETINLPIYALSFVCVFLSVVFNTLTWHRILSDVSVKVPFLRAFNLTWVGLFVDALIPGGWPGDIFKAYLLSKDQKRTGARITASIVVKNVFAVLLTLVTVVIGIVLLALNYEVANVVLVAIGVTMLLLALSSVLIIYLSINISAATKLLNLFSRTWGRIKRNKVAALESETSMQNSLNDFHEGIMLMKANPRLLVTPAIFQTVAWVFEMLARFLIFVAIGYAISADKVIITNTIVASIQAQGIVLASLAQIVSSTIYAVLGISPLISVTSSLLAGFSTFWIKTAVAFFFFQIIVFSPCIPFFCKKCSGLRRKNCPEKQIGPIIIENAPPTPKE